MARPTDHPSIDTVLGRCTFPPAGTAVTCAVSGGADSVALLALAVATGCRVTAVHVDHGLRVGSAEESNVVRAIAEHLGADMRAVAVHVDHGPNLEARARRARYAVLPADVMTGHTADDQAETVLVNLLRGAGSAGLSGMRPGHRRPLLALRRTDTVAVAEPIARAAGVSLVDDPSNQDTRHLRNRVRHDLLPRLDAAAQRDLTPVLVRQADLLRDESDLLDQWASTLDPTDARALATAPVPLARRAVRTWLTGDHPPDAATVERVLAVARGDAAACDIGAGRSVRRSHQRLAIHADA
jgi:tRNA(Ile)-lysidine synthase